MSGRCPGSAVTRLLQRLPGELGQAFDLVLVDARRCEVPGTTPVGFDAVPRLDDLARERRRVRLERAPDAVAGKPFAAITQRLGTLPSACNRHIPHIAVSMFFFDAFRSHRDPHSFPTRRSSD